MELGGARWIVIGVALHDRAHEQAILEPESRLARPRRPCRGTDKRASVELDAFAVSRIGNHSTADIVREFAAREGEVTDRLPALCLDIEAGTRRAVDDRSSRVIELTAGKVVA